MEAGPANFPEPILSLIMAMVNSNMKGGLIMARSVSRMLPLFLVLLSASRLAAREEAQRWTDVLISPRRVAEPLLAQRLFPDASRRRPGDAPVILLRILCERHPATWERLVKNAKKYLEMPAQEFSAQKAREEVPLFPVEELRRAAFRKDADWQYPIREGVPLDSTFIPDIADTRQLLRGLAVHCRADIAEGKIDAALDKITVGLGLTAHL